MTQIVMMRYDNKILYNILLTYNKIILILINPRQQRSIKK